jgi:hypothetical protein
MILWVLCIFFLSLALVLFFYAIAAFRQRYLIAGLSRLLISSLMLCLGLLASIISLGIRGYQALTQEQLAATVTIQKIETQRFEAQFVFPDGKQESFELAGDEMLVDAHILKWHPWSNILGLHTVYKLDRIAGRYTSIDDEQTEQRTVYSLADDNPINLFAISKRIRVKPFLDAQYGSGTFLPVEDQGVYEIYVSTSGLLIRQVNH